MSGLSLAALLSPRRRTPPTPPQQASSSSQGDGGDVELGGSRRDGSRVSSGESAGGTQAHVEAPTPADNESSSPTPQTPESRQQTSESARNESEQALVDESLAQPLTWSRKETLPSGLWDLELLEDSDESGNDDDDDTTSSTRREYALVYAPWSSGAALSPLVCISALNFGGLLPIAVAFGLPIGPLVLPNPATAEHYSPVWWLFALLALPACFFGFFDLQSRPAFDFLARSLEFYQVIVAFLASAAYLIGFSTSYSRPAAPWLPWALLQIMCVCAATLGPDALRRALLARAKQHLAYRDRLLEQLRSRALPLAPLPLSATEGTSRNSSAEGLDSLVPPPPPPPLSSSVELTPSSRALAAHAATEALEAVALAERFARDAAAADAAAQVVLCSAEAHGAWACGAKLWAPLLRLASFLGLATTGSAALMGWCLTYSHSSSGDDSPGKSTSSSISENGNKSGNAFVELWRVCAPALVALGLSAALVVVLVAGALCTLVRRLPRHPSSSGRSAAATFDNSLSSSPAIGATPDTTRQLSRRISRRLLASTSFQPSHINPRSRANSSSNLDNDNSNNGGRSGSGTEPHTSQCAPNSLLSLVLPLMGGYALAIIVPGFALCLALAPVHSPQHPLTFVAATAVSGGSQQGSDAALAAAAWVIWAACVGIGMSGVVLLLHLTLRTVFRRGLLLAGVTPYLRAQRAVARSSTVADAANGRADRTEAPTPGASFVATARGLDASGRRGATAGVASAAMVGSDGEGAPAGPTGEGFGWRHHQAAYTLSSLFLPFALHALFALPVLTAALAVTRATSATLRVASSSEPSVAGGHNGNSQSREELLLPGCPALLTVIEVDLFASAGGAVLYLAVGLLELSRLPSKHLHRLGRFIRGIVILNIIVRFLLMVALRGACDLSNLVDLGNGSSSGSSRASNNNQKVVGAAVVLALSVSVLGFFVSVGAVGLWALRMAGAAKLEGPIASILGFPAAYFTSHASRRCGKVVGWHAVMLLAHAPFTLPLDAAAHWLSPTSARAHTHSSSGSSNFFGLSNSDTTTWEAALGGAVSAPALASLSTVVLLLASVYVTLRGRLLGPPRLPTWFQHDSIILGCRSGRIDASPLAELHAQKLKPAWAAPALLLLTALCTAATTALLLTSSIVFWAENGAFVATNGDVEYDDSIGDDSSSTYGTGGGNGNVAAWLTIVSAALRLICVNLWLQLRQDSGSFGTAALALSLSSAHIAEHLSLSASSTPSSSSLPSIRNASAIPRTYSDASLLREYPLTPRRMSRPPSQSISRDDSSEQPHRRRAESIDRAPSSLIDLMPETPTRSNTAAAAAAADATLAETPTMDMNDSQANSSVTFDPVSDLASAPVNAPAPIPASVPAPASSAAQSSASQSTAATPSRVPPLLTTASNLGRWMRRRAVGGRRFEHGRQGASGDPSGSNSLEQFEWVRDLGDDGEVIWVPIHERHLRPPHLQRTCGIDSTTSNGNKRADDSPPLATSAPSESAAAIITRDSHPNVDDDTSDNTFTAMQTRPSDNFIVCDSASDDHAITTLRSTNAASTPPTSDIAGVQVAVSTPVKNSAPKRSSRATDRGLSERAPPVTSSPSASPHPRKSKSKTTPRRSMRSPKGTALDETNKPRERTLTASAGGAVVEQLLSDVLDTAIASSDDQIRSSKCDSGDCKEDNDDEEIIVSQDSNGTATVNKSVNEDASPAFGDVPSGHTFVANDNNAVDRATFSRQDGTFALQQLQEAGDSRGVGLAVRVLPPLGGAVAWTDGWMLSAEASLAVCTKSLVFQGGVEIGAVPAVCVPTHELASVTLKPFEEKREWFIAKCQQLKVPWRGGHQEITVRRSHLIADSITALSLRTPRQFRELWRFKYEGELGIDSGGVSREWWESICGALLDSSSGMFEHAATDNLSYQINAAGAEVKLAQAQESNAREANARMVAATQRASDQAAKQIRAGAEDTSATIAVEPTNGTGEPTVPADRNDLNSGKGADAGYNEDHDDVNTSSATITKDAADGGGLLTSMDNELAGLEAYRFVGRLLGKALLDQQTVPAFLCRPLFKHVLGWPIGLPDLEFTDASLHQTLTWLLDPNNSTVVGDLDIVFAVDEPNPFAGSSGSGGGSSGSSGNASVGSRAIGPIRTRPLVPGGENVPLRATNLKQFVNLRFKDAMQTKPGYSAALGSFLSGWYEVLPLGLMSPFTPAELELLLCGVATLDVEEWRKASVYVGGYSAASPTIVAFWACIEALPDAGRSRVLQFVTGTSRLPAGGFRALQGNDGDIRHFTIDRVPANHLPRAHTCFNRLDLPAITDPAALRSMLQHLLLADLDGFNIA